MQGHVYHWKHGWIPLTHYAALVKAKGNHKAAARYLDKSNGHHGSASHALTSEAEAAKKHAANESFKADHIGDFRAHGLNSRGVERNSGGGYTEGDRIEHQGYDFSKPGFPMVWHSATVDKIEPNGKYHQITLLRDDGTRHVELVGPRGGNKNLRKSTHTESARTDAATSRAYAEQARISAQAAAKRAGTIHGGFKEGAHVAYNGRASDGTGTVEGSRKLNGETILQVRDHKDGKVYEWAPQHVAEIPKASEPAKVAKATASEATGAQQDSEKARLWAAKAKQLDTAAAAKRAEAQRIADGVGWGDRAAGRLKPSALKQAHRSTDSALRRHTEAMQEAKALEHKAHLARARAEEASRARLTHEDVKGATHVQDSNGWHEVVRVNAKSVTVKTPYSWTDTIPHDKIHKVRKAG